MDIREKLQKLFDEAARICNNKSCNNKSCNRCSYLDVPSCVDELAIDHLIANGVTVQERNEEGCPYCDIAKANEGVVNTKLWVKEAETSKWTMMGKRLIFCPMCGRALPQPQKGEQAGMEYIKVRSDYDPDTYMQIVHNNDGDFIFKTRGNGEMRIALSGGQFHGKQLTAICEAAKALMEALAPKGE